MNYIYDITLNLNKNNMYEFYEWKEEDSPEFILKIPAYKVDIETFLDIKNNDIIINKSFLQNIEDKTETYTPSSISIIRYACVFISENKAFAIEFDSEGNNYMKSSISIDEENEIIETVKNIKYSIIDYKVKNKYKKINKYTTRKEEELENYLLKKIEYMINNNEVSKLKYIFYELYNEKNDDIDKIYNKLINIIRNSDSKLLKLNEVLDLIDNKKIINN